MFNCSKILQKCLEWSSFLVNSGKTNFSKLQFKEHLRKYPFKVIVHQNKFQPNINGSNDEK